MVSFNVYFYIRQMVNAVKTPVVPYFFSQFDISLLNMKITDEQCNERCEEMMG
jgi:hypothetical protein